MQRQSPLPRRRYCGDVVVAGRATHRQESKQKPRRLGSSSPARSRRHLELVRAGFLLLRFSNFAVLFVFASHNSHSARIREEINPSDGRNLFGLAPSESARANSELSVAWEPGQSL